MQTYMSKRSRQAAAPSHTVQPPQPVHTGMPPVPSAAPSDTDDHFDLKAAMESRMEEHFPGIFQLSQGSGRALQLPEELRSGIESQFGHSVDNLKFRESSDVNSIGAKAYAKGDEIHFAPGQFRPDTELGRKMIGHEVAHIAQQARGGLGTGVNLDPSMEHQADLQGDALAAHNISSAESGGVALSPMPTASFSSAPAQGWGISILNTGGGEHELLTKAARKKASAFLAGKGARENLTSDRAKASLQYGSRFNDVGHHGALGMVAQMEMLKEDAFINQTHHGDMQFLHSMDTSGGDTKANIAKIRRYAQFTSDVYQNRDTGNGTKFQDQNMLDYVLSQRGEDDPFQEMMLSTMLDPAALSALDQELDADPQYQGNASEKKAARIQRMIALAKPSEEELERARAEAAQKYDQKGRLKKRRAGDRDAYIQRKVEEARTKNLSRYAMGTVGDFFTNGDERLDAGLVALGSASHMLEDSYAGSHSIRSDNLYLSGSPDTELSDTGTEIVSKSTPIMSNADYNQQSNFVIGGRHGKGDKFEKGKGLDGKIRNTQGGALARDSAAQFMAMNVRMKEQREATGVDTGYEGSDLDRFVQGIVQMDQNVALLGGATATGRGYDKKMSHSARRGLSKDVRKGVKGYWDKTGENVAGNKHTTADARIGQLEQEIPDMERILRSTEERDRPAQEKYRAHAREMIANIQSMADQLATAGGPPNQVNALLALQGRLIALLY